MVSYLFFLDCILRNPSIFEDMTQDEIEMEPQNKLQWHKNKKR